MSPTGETSASGVGTEPILGYSVANAGTDGCVSAMMRALGGSASCRWLACLNPHSYVVARDQPSFRDALSSCDWLLPDGAGIVLASRLLGGSIRSRVTGMDAFIGLTRALDQQGGGSVFFLGSTEETLRLIRDRMAREFPRVRVAGTHAPPYRDTFSAEDDDAMIEAVNRARPDVLWVGMTAPKQELWLHEHRDQLEVKVAAAIGAVFDFYSGRVKRSHPVFQRLGLEWLPRLVRQPRRLWRRTFVSAPRFLLDVLRATPAARRSAP